MSHLHIEDQIGNHSEYTITQASPHRSGWHVKDKQGQIWYLRTQEVPLPLDLDQSRIEREQKSILREAKRWEGLHIARPEVQTIFWHHRQLCWVESILEGASLSSLQHPLQNMEAFYLLEESLYALKQLHQTQDFTTGEPLLHLNITDKNIWRSTQGGLYLLNPTLPQWIDLQYRFSPQVLDHSSPYLAPELKRGRCGMSSDLYSLGMCVLSAMTQMNVQQIDRRLQSGSLFEHDLEVPDCFKEILKKMTEYRASQRFESAQSALKALRELPAEDLQSMQLQFQQYKQEQALLAEENLLENESSTIENEPAIENHATEDQSAKTSEEPHHTDHDNELILYESTIDHDPTFYVKSEGEHHIDHVEVLAVEDTSTRTRTVMSALILISVLALGYWWGRDGSSNQQTTLKQNQSPIVNTTQKHDQIDPPKKAQSFLKPVRRPGSKYHSAKIQWIMLNAGQVNIGGTKEEGGYTNEYPSHTVKIEPFAMSISEVTVAQYAQCVSEGICDKEGLSKPSWGNPNLCNWNQVNRWFHPINCITWQEADTFARWAGGRLPSEAEWAYAAKSQGKFQLYPWGDKSNADCTRAVLADVQGDGCGQKMTWPVCSKTLGNSQQGICDLIGNVWEWVQDEAHENYEQAPLTGEAWITSAPNQWPYISRMYRGGGAFDERDLPRVARRGHREPDVRLYTLGFRIVKSVPIEINKLP